MFEDKLLAGEIIPDISSLEPIKDGQSGSCIYRAEKEGGGKFVLKITRPENIPDYLLNQYPKIADVEFYFYREIFPHLEFPAPIVYEQALLPGGGNYILLSDISESFNIPSQTKYLKKESWEKILRSFAAFHYYCRTSFGKNGIPDWLNPSLFDKFSPEKTISTLFELARIPNTKKLVEDLVNAPGLEKLAEKTQEKTRDIDPTLVHNDFFPGNIGLPLSKKDKAAILDWQLASSGPAEIDLSQMDLQWDDYWLEFYLEKLHELGEEKKSPGDFRENFLFCQLLNDGIFLPVILKAAQRNIKENKNLSPWMEECLKKFVQNWKKALDNFS